MNEKVRSYFNCSKRERAVFETGIKLGGLFHQFMGVAINEHNREEIEKAIEAAVRIQPFVNDIKVKISKECLRDGDYTLDYSTLSPNMLDVILEIKYEHVIVIGRLKYIEEMDYPLMFVEDIIEETE